MVQAIVPSDRRGCYDSSLFAQHLVAPLHRRCCSPESLTLRPPRSPTHPWWLPILTKQKQTVFVPDDSGIDGPGLPPDHINGDGSPDPALCRSGGANASNSGNFSNPAVMAATTRMRAGQVARLQSASPPAFPRSRLQWHGLTTRRALHATSEVDGTSRPEQNKANTSDWKSVKNDAYNIQNTGSINLLTQFPTWSGARTPTSPRLRNDNYVLPGNVEGADYTVYHATVATGTAFRQGRTRRGKPKPQPLRTWDHTTTTSWRRVLHYREPERLQHHARREPPLSSQAALVQFRRQRPRVHSRSQFLPSGAQRHFPARQVPHQVLCGGHRWQC